MTAHSLKSAGSRSDPAPRRSDLPGIYSPRRRGFASLERMRILLTASTSAVLLVHRLLRVDHRFRRGRIRVRREQPVRPRCDPRAHLLSGATGDHHSCVRLDRPRRPLQRLWNVRRLPARLLWLRLDVVELSKPGPATCLMPPGTSRSDMKNMPLADLEVGDAMIKLPDQCGSKGHIRLFGGWIDCNAGLVLHPRGVLDGKGPRAPRKPARRGQQLHGHRAHGSFVATASFLGQRRPRTADRHRDDHESDERDPRRLRDRRERDALSRLGERRPVRGPVGTSWARVPRIACRDGASAKWDPRRLRDQERRHAHARLGERDRSVARLGRRRRRVPGLPAATASPQSGLREVYAIETNGNLLHNWGGRDGSCGTDGTSPAEASKDRRPRHRIRKTGFETSTRSRRTATCSTTGRGRPARGTDGISSVEDSKDCPRRARRPSADFARSTRSKTGRCFTTGRDATGSVEWTGHAMGSGLQGRPSVSTHPTTACVTMRLGKTERSSTIGRGPPDRGGGWDAIGGGFSGSPASFASPTSGLREVIAVRNGHVMHDWAQPTGPWAGLDGL